MGEAERDWPFDTVRGHFPDDNNPTFAAAVRNYQSRLRRAGERDHAEEDADFGVAENAALHADLVGYTPRTAPGARTIHTADLPTFIAERKPIIVDPATYFWGRSIPGAVGLKDAGVGGTVSDGAQEPLGREMAELTGGDSSRPIVAVGWNSERFDGRNLALRLVALGYKEVYWYRGGREAWEVAGLPEAEIDVVDWQNWGDVPRKSMVPFARVPASTRQVSYRNWATRRAARRRLLSSATNNCFEVSVISSRASRYPRGTGQTGGRGPVTSPSCSAAARRRSPTQCRTVVGRARNPSTSLSRHSWGALRHPSFKGT